MEGITMQDNSDFEHRLVIEDKDFLEEEKTFNDQSQEAQYNIGILKVKTANKWIEEAKRRPIPRMLFDQFWFENELCILFADTNLGKSILAVQIADSISSGLKIPGFHLESIAQPVLYFDFELSDKQFENRYSKDFKDHYVFDTKLTRVEINPDFEVQGDSSFEELLNQSIEKAILKTGSKVLIIDNLTYLKNDTERAVMASPLMKQLKALKNKYGLSILALAHTPKRDLSKPITRNDLSGSKMLMNFVDSCFAIGESKKDKNIRYIKQIKVRQNEFLFDSENVCACEINKLYNFLQFTFLQFESEREHLKELSHDDRAQNLADAIDLKEQGMTNMEVARRMGVSEGAVRKWLKKAELQR